MASIDTNQSMRDDHLRTNDFFDAENYPTITIKSTGLERVTDAEWKLSTDLTIRGVTKPVVFDLEYLGEGPSMQEGKTVVAFSATAEIDRRDFGVSFNHSLLDGSVVVGQQGQDRAGSRSRPGGVTNRSTVPVRAQRTAVRFAAMRTNPGPSLPAVAATPLRDRPDAPPG